MRFAIPGLLLLAACASQQVHKENVIQRPVIVALALCDQPGKAAASLGKDGEKMICERTVPTGGHTPQCMCRDQGFIAQQRAETQDILTTRFIHR